MKAIKYITIAISILVLFSCNKDMDDNNKNLNNFDFENLEVGQSFQYVLLLGEEYWDDNKNNDFSYTADTLEIEIIGKTSNSFTVREQLLPTSFVFLAENPYYWHNPDSVFINEWVIENNTLTIKQDEEFPFTSSSHLFFGLWTSSADFTLDLNDFQEEETEIEGWKTTTGYCECDRDLFVKDLELLEINYNRLNVAIRNTPMQVDGPGISFVYNLNEGIVRTSTYSWWTGTGQGWDRIR